jgi:hypothetical protein
MGVYGNYINEDAMLEYVVLQEMKFSKQDLQDPKTIEKILKGSKIFKSVEMFIYTLLLILTIIISAFTFFIGLIPMVLLFATISNVLNSYESRQKDKNLNKLKEKCTKLKNKSEEKLKTTNDLKEKQKLKETIDGCNKVLAKIKELEEIDKNMNLNASIKVVEELIKWYQDPNSFYSDDLYFSNVFFAAKVYKIPEGVLINKIKTIKETISLEDIAIGDEEKYKELLRDIGIKDMEKDFIVIISHDDYYLLYDNTIGLFVLSYNSVYKVSSLYSEIDMDNPEKVKDKFGKVKIIRITEKEIIAADKALGYFKLTECPKQVIPNEFPIKY